MGKTTVRDAMTSGPSTVASDATVEEAARTMTAQNVGSLPVVQDGKLVGIVTDRDIVTNVVAKGLDSSKVPVSEVCSENPIVASPEEPLDAALQRMAGQQVRRLPVVEADRLVGILAQADVAKSARPDATGQMVEEISQS